MHLTQSQDQRIFLDAARDFLRKTYPLERLRGDDLGPLGFDREWWRRAAELGWAALLAPQDLGGGTISDDGITDLSMLAAELGAGVSPGPLLAVNVVIAGLVAASDSGPDHSSAIVALAAGAQIATWAVYEPGTRFNPLAPEMTARPEGNGFRLNGVKDRVEAATAADQLLVTASGPDGFVQLLVPADSPGITVRPQWSLDLGRGFGSVHFDGVEVGADCVVGTPGEQAPVQRQRHVAAVIQCAEVCGGLGYAFGLTMQWANDRYSFGRPLGSYQALKHKLADMRTNLEGCQAISVAAAEAVGRQSPDADALVSAAKAFVGRRSLSVLQDCVQLHGGIGVTWEHDLHLFLRRATTNQSLYGTPAEHAQRLAEGALDEELVSR